MSFEFKKNRKSQFFTVQTLVIAVIIFILLISVGAIISLFIKREGSLAACTASIELADVTAKIKKRSFNAIDAMPDLNCKSQELIISFDKKTMYERGKKLIDDDKVKKILANSLYSCWKTVGAGDLNPFRQFGPELDKTFCMSCYDIRFDDSFKKQANAQKYKIDDLDYWLATHYVPGSNSSYYEHLYKKSPSQSEINSLAADGDIDTLDIESAYTVVWRTDINDHSAILVGAAAGSAIAFTVTGGMALGATGGTIAIMAAKTAIGASVASTVVYGQTSLWVSYHMGPWLVPESLLSGKVKPPYLNKEEDMCTILLN